MTGHERPPGQSASWFSWRGLGKLVVWVLIGAGILWTATTLFLLFVGFNDAPGEWSMIIYYDRADRTRFVVTPRFQTLAYCRQSAVDRMKELGIDKTGDYECGFRCERGGDPHRANICEEAHK